MAALPYRREIDGLRAFAVLPVLFFHAGFEIFSGGFVGVDIFFVISGYLITSILISEMEVGKFSLLKFYERRARRILPALCTVMLVSVVAAYVIMLPHQWQEFLQSMVAVIFFISNIFFWLEDDYFAVASEEKPLLHSWSLAVEEQYYILFPVLLIMVWRFGRNPMLYIIAGLALLSFLSAAMGSRYYPNANFYLLFGRAWEILLGAIVAFHMMKVNVRPLIPAYANFLSWMGFLMLVLAIFLFDKDTPFPSPYTLLPAIGTSLLIVFTNEKTILGKILSYPLLVGVGLISYSLYLWHQPVFAFGRLLIFDLNVPVKIMLILLSIILAIISYYIIEKPARFRWLQNEKPLYFFAKTMLIPLILLAFSAIFLWSKAAPFNNIEGQNYAGDDKDWNYQVKVEKNVSGRFLLYGDSHARQYAEGLEDYALAQNYNFQLIAGPACISLPGLTNYYRGEVSSECISQWQRLYNESHLSDTEKDIIVIAHRWGPLLSDVKGKAIGKIGHNNDEAASAAMIGALDALFIKFPSDQKIIIIGNVPAAASASPEMKQGWSRCRQYINTDCTMSFPRKDGELYAFNQRLKNSLSDYPNIYFIDPYDSLCDDQKCYVGRDKDIYYSDDAHLTDMGVDRFLEQTKPMLDKVSFIQ